MLESALESYVNWRRPLDNKDPRTYARKAVFDSLSKIESATETYNAFQKLFDKGAKVKHIKLKLGKNKFSVIQLFDAKNNPLAVKYNKKIYPEGYVELPDDMGILKLADFYDSVISGEFEFGKSYKNPKKWLRRFTKKIVNAKKQNITTEFKQDLEDNLINTYAIPAGAVGKDFGKFLWHVQKYNKKLFDTLNLAYTSRYGSYKGGITGPLWNTLEEKVSTIIEKEREQVVTKTVPLSERIASFVKEICDIRAAPAKTLIATTMMVLAAVFGATLKGAKNVSADDSSDLEDTLETNSRQIPETVVLTNNSAKHPSNPAIYEDKIVWCEDDALILHGAGVDKTFGTSDDIQKRIFTWSEDDDPLHIYPDIYGNYIVWSSNGLFLYDTRTDTVIETGISNATYPSIYGNLVVYGTYDQNNIGMYKIGTRETSTLIENQPSNKPRIWKYKVVFESDPAPSKLYLYDLEGQITKASDSSGGWPDIWEDRIVWEYFDFGGGSDIIYFKNLTSGEEKRFEGNNPHIYGDQIIYTYPNYGDDLYVFNLKNNEKTRITTESSSVDGAIWKDKIAWREWIDKPDFNNSYIFLLNQNKPPENQPPIAKINPEFQTVELERDGNSLVVLNGGDSFDPDGLIADYYWDSNKSVIISPHQKSIALVFSKPDYYGYTLKVKDDDGAWSEPTHATIQVIENTTNQKIKQYAPTFVLSKDENYMPAPPERIADAGDDKFVFNNRENYDNNPGLFAVDGKPVVFAQEPQEIGEFTYYTYWLYYANNSVPIDAHEHDWEYVIVREHTATGKVVDRAASFHLVGHKRTRDLSDPVFIEEDGHAMSFNKDDFDPENKYLFKHKEGGKVLGPDDYVIIPLEDIVGGENLDEHGRYISGPSDHAAGDLKRYGDALLMKIFGKRACAPWEQDIYNNPELAWKNSTLEEIIAFVGSPVDLVVKDSNGVEVKYHSDNIASVTEDAIFIRNASDDYTYEVIGKEKGTFNLTIIRAGEDGTVKVQITDMETNTGEVHKIKVNRDKAAKDKKGALTISSDEDGDGNFESTVKAKSHITGEEYEKLKSEEKQSPSWYCAAAAVIATAAISTGVYIKKKLGLGRKKEKSKKRSKKPKRKKKSKKKKKKPKSKKTSKKKKEKLETLRLPELVEDDENEELEPLYLPGLAEE